MQSVDLTGLNKLDKDLQEILDEFPERRTELHEEIADIIKDEVEVQIAQSGLNDTIGKVKEWQTAYVGSGGGYAAVRATDKEIGDNSPGAITNYLENGHQIRTPSGSNKRYRPRIKKPYVDGFHFYAAARNTVEAKAIKAAEEFAEKFAKKLEGEN
jgi:hypothetical protein